MVLSEARIAAMNSLVWWLALIGVWAPCATLQAQDVTSQVLDAPRPLPTPGAPRRVAQARLRAQIYWQQLPLRDAVSRVEELFDEAVFVDRRVDLSERISLDIAASSAIEVLAPIATAKTLGVSPLGQLTYLGPHAAAKQFGNIIALRTSDVKRLGADARASLEQRRQLSWPRLTEPRGLVTSLVERRGWRVVNAERIPHDLWPAGRLPELSAAEQLTVLLIGFDLTFEVRPKERVIEIVPLTGAVTEAKAPLGRKLGAERQTEVKPNAERQRPARASRETKQVYTLRVTEQPVGVVLRELAERLNWRIDVDEASITAAGRSLDDRVSFTVEDAEQDELLNALLRPAGLDFRREDERIKIVPRP